MSSEDNTGDEHSNAESKGNTKNTNGNAEITPPPFSTLEKRKPVRFTMDEDDFIKRGIKKRH